MLRALWHYVRAGQIREAQEYCRASRQWWRAASIGGGTAWQWDGAKGKWVGNPRFAGAARARRSRSGRRRGRARRYDDEAAVYAVLSDCVGAPRHAAPHHATPTTPRRTTQLPTPSPSPSYSCSTPTSRPLRELGGFALGAPPPPLRARPPPSSPLRRRRRLAPPRAGRRRRRSRAAARRPPRAAPERARGAAPPLRRAQAPHRRRRRRPRRSRCRRWHGGGGGGGGGGRHRELQGAILRLRAAQAPGRPPTARGAPTCRRRRCPTRRRPTSAPCAPSSPRTPTCTPPAPGAAAAPAAAGGASRRILAHRLRFGAHLGLFLSWFSHAGSTGGPAAAARARARAAGLGRR